MKTEKGTKREKMEEILINISLVSSKEIEDILVRRKTSR